MVTKRRKKYWNGSMVTRLPWQRLRQWNSRFAMCDGCSPSQNSRILHYPKPFCKALATMGKLAAVEGLVARTLEKLPGIKGDLVRNDPDWKKWGFQKPLNCGHWGTRQILRRKILRACQENREIQSIPLLPEIARAAFIVVTHINQPSETPSSTQKSEKSSCWIISGASIVLPSHINGAAAQVRVLV